MAATYRASASGGGTSGSSNRAVTLTPVVGDLLFVAVVVTGNVNDAPTMSDNQGGTYYRALCVPWSTSANRLAVFVREQLVASAVSHTITAATGSNTAAQLTWVAWSGMTRTGQSAIRSLGSQSNAAAGTPAPALDQAALTGNPTMVGVGSGDTTTTPPTNWLERQDTSQSTPTAALEVATRDSGFAGTTITFGAAQSTVFASFAIELDSSAAPIVVTPTPAIAALGGTEPSLAFGSIEVTPVPAAMSASVSGDAAMGALAVTPTPAVATTSASDPTVEVGEASGITVTPEPAIASFGGAEPSVSFGGIIVTPTPATADASVSSPSVGFGALSVTPTPAIAVAQATPWDVEFGGIQVTPAPAIIASAVESPDVQFGALARTPVPAVMTAAATDPSVGLGALVRVPTPAVLYALAFGSTPSDSCVSALLRRRARRRRR